MENRDYNESDYNYGATEPYGYQQYNNQEYSHQQYNYQQNASMVDAAGNPLKSRFAVQLVFAIIEILLCCFSPVAMILGIIALVFAVQANTAFQLGRAEEFKVKSKTSNILLIIGGVFAAIAIIFNIVIISLNMTMFKGIFSEVENAIIEEYEQEENWNDAGKIEEELEPDIVEDYPGVDDVYLPEGFETFTYNGVVYSVPMSYVDFQKMGYMLEEEYQGYVFEPQTYESMGFYDEEGNEIGEIRISNDTDQRLALEEGIVDYIYFDNPASYITDGSVSNIDLTFGNGFDMNTSYEELEEWLGVPYYVYTDTSDGTEYTSYEWTYYGEDKYQRIIVNYLDGVITNIMFEQYDFVY